MNKELKDILEEINSQIKNNTIILEEVRNDINKVIKTQTKHRQQNGRQYNETMRVMNEKYETVYSATKNVGQEITKYEKRLDNIERAKESKTDFILWGEEI